MNNPEALYQHLEECLKHLQGLLLANDSPVILHRTPNAMQAFQHPPLRAPAKWDDRIHRLLALYYTSDVVHEVDEVLAYWREVVKHYRERRWGDAIKTALMIYPCLTPTYGGNHRKRMTEEIMIRFIHMAGQEPGLRSSITENEAMLFIPHGKKEYPLGFQRVRRRGHTIYVMHTGEGKMTRIDPRVFDGYKFNDAVNLFCGNHERTDEIVGAAMTHYRLYLTSNLPFAEILCAVLAKCIKDERVQEMLDEYFIILDVDRKDVMDRAIGGHGRMAGEIFLAANRSNDHHGPLVYQELQTLLVPHICDYETFKARFGKERVIQRTSIAQRRSRWAKQLAEMQSEWTAPLVSEEETQMSMYVKQVFGVIEA